MAPDVASLVEHLAAAIEQAAVVLLELAVAVCELDLLVFVFWDAFKKISLSLGVRSEILLFLLSRSESELLPRLFGLAFAHVRLIGFRIRGYALSAAYLEIPAFYLSLGRLAAPNVLFR